MRSRLLPLLASVLLVPLACGGEAPPAQTTPAPGPAVVTLPAPAPSAAAPTKAASAEPTVRTEEESARDKALTPKVEAILDAFGNFDAILSKDGSKVLFRSNRDTAPEVYVSSAAKPSEPPVKIVSGPERVRFALLTVDDKYVLYTRDKGANELFHIYRCGLDGKDTVDLTPQDGIHRHVPVLPRKKPDTMFFSGASPSSPETKVWAQGISKGEAELLYTDPGPAFAIDADPSGGHVLVLRIVSLSEQIVLDLDVATKKARRIYPRDESKKVNVSWAAYSGDGKRILIASDDGTETNTLYALDATSLAEKAKYTLNEPATGSISAVFPSPRGDRLAVVVDAGSHTEVRLHDASTLALIKKVEAPLGTISAAPFSGDGKSFTVSESSPDKPRDIYLVDAKTGAVKPLRDDKRPGLADLPALTTKIEMVKAHDGLTIPMNVYLPKELAPGKKLATIASFHGGPAASSSIGWSATARFFTSQGYAVVEPNIRGSTGFGRAYEMADNKEKRGDAIKDVATVNAWIKAQPWADPERVVIMGGSYGGYLVLMGLTRQPGLWRAGVDMVGVANLFTFLKSTDQAIRTVFVDEFGDLDRDKALLEQYSPFAQVDKITAPLFVYQGQNDPRVPRPESDQIVASLRGRKIPVEYMVMPNEGHSLDRRPSRIEFMTRTARFLAENLK